MFLSNLDSSAQCLDTVEFTLKKKNQLLGTSSKAKYKQSGFRETTMMTTGLVGQMVRTAIFIHGAGGGGWEWKAWIPEFETAGWICIAPDLVPSPSGIAVTRFQDYLDQVIQCRHYETEALIVYIGASMGGLLALKAHESYPANALVLINSVGPKGFASEVVPNYPDVIEWSKGNLQESQEAMPDSDPETVQFAFERWRDESGQVLRELHYGIPVDLPTCRTLVIVGSEDKDVPPTVGTDMTELYGADLIVYEGMSHVGPLLGTRATEVARDTLAWLELSL